MIIGLSSCQNEPTKQNDSETSVLENSSNITIIEKYGCNSSVAPCIDININFPKFDELDAELKKEVHELMKDHITDFLVTDKPVRTDELSSYLSETVSAIIESAQESSSVSKLKYHSDFISLFQNDQLICLQNQYEYIQSEELITGEAYFLFDIENKHLLYVDEIVNDFPFVEQLLLRRVKEQNNVPLDTDIKELGFLVEDRDFAITDNIGITDQQVIFTYQSQEIAPSSSGIFRFMINKDEIKDHLQEDFVKKWESPQ